MSTLVSPSPFCHSFPVSCCVPLEGPNPHIRLGFAFGFLFRFRGWIPTFVLALGVDSVTRLVLGVRLGFGG